MYHTKCFPSPQDYLLGRGAITRNIRSVPPSPSRSTNASSTNTRTTTITTTVVSRQTSTNTPVSQRAVIILSRKRSSRPEADVRPRAFCRGCRRRRKVNPLNTRCSRCDDKFSAADDEHTSPDSTVTRSSTNHTSSSPSSRRTSLMNVSTVNLGTAHQAQLLSAFLEAHFPVATPLESDMHRKSSWMAQLPTIDLSSPLLSSAICSLCLEFEGARSNNASITYASRNAYAKVLAFLKRALSMSTSRHTPFSDRDVISAILVLSLTDNSTCPNPTNSKVWMTHFWGALQYMQSRGRSCLDLERFFDTNMFRNIRFPALVLSFARREPSLFEQHEWRTAQSQHIQGPGGNDWFPMLPPLGRLLHRADALLECPSPPSTHAIHSLRKDFADFTQPLMAFIHEELRVVGGKLGVGTVNTTDLTAFDHDIEEHCFMVSHHVFPHQFIFLGGARQIFRCGVSFFVLLIANCTMMRLMLRYPHHFTDISMADLEQQAHSQAQNLCRSVYEYSQLSSLAYAYFQDAFLRLAEAFLGDFERAPQELEWTRGCMKALHTRIVRMEATKHPSLCRARDLVQDFARAGRYKGREHVDEIWDDGKGSINTG